MELKLPELGEGVHEGELVKWNVKVGDVVKDDQSVCEIMTDKATVDLPAPFSGKITSLDAKEGSVVKVGQTMLQYTPVGASASATQSNSQTQKASATTLTVQQPAAAVSSPNNVASSAIAAAPSTRRFAREQGVVLSQVEASGPNGRVMREDVERAVAGGSGAAASKVSLNTAMGSGAVAAGSPKAAPQSLPTRSIGPAQKTEERIPFRGLRKKISEKMRLSKDKAAHFTYVEEADVTALVELRNQAKDMGAKYGIKVTYLPFIMKAMVAALRKYPMLNSSLDEATGEIVVKHYYNIGLSVQTDDGLSAPIIKDVGNKTVLEIARDIQAVVERARAKKLTMDDLQGGTITLTNAGTIGGLFATPVINFPEVAILGFNKIFRKPVVKVVTKKSGKVKEEIVIRDWTYFSISLDHRIVDGAVGAEFMKAFIQYIENPALLVVDSI